LDDGDLLKFSQSLTRQDGTIVQPPVNAPLNHSQDHATTVQIGGDLICGQQQAHQLSLHVGLQVLLVSVYSHVQRSGNAACQYSSLKETNTANAGQRISFCQYSSLKETNPLTCVRRLTVVVNSTGVVEIGHLVCGDIRG